MSSDKGAELLVLRFTGKEFAGRYLKLYASRISAFNNVPVCTFRWRPLLQADWVML
jgi:hypothetical protein